MAPLSVEYFKSGIIAFLCSLINSFLNNLFALTPPLKTKEFTLNFVNASLVFEIK